jgi:hypothetical protein
MPPVSRIVASNGLSNHRPSKFFDLDFSSNSRELVAERRFTKLTTEYLVL